MKARDMTGKLYITVQLGKLPSCDKMLAHVNMEFTFQNSDDCILVSGDDRQEH